MQRSAHSKKKNLCSVTLVLNSSRTVPETQHLVLLEKAPWTCLAFSSSIQSISTNFGDIITYKLQLSNLSQFNAMNQSCKSFLVYSCFFSNVIQHNSYAHFSKSWNHLIFCPPLKIMIIQNNVSDFDHCLQTIQFSSNYHHCVFSLDQYLTKLPLYRP